MPPECKLCTYRKRENGYSISKIHGFLNDVINRNPEYIYTNSHFTLQRAVDLVARDVINEVNVENNAYYKESFLKNVREPNYIGSTECFVDGHYTQEHEKKASIIFCHAMMRELNCFLQAGGQNLFSAEDIVNF